MKLLSDVNVLLALVAEGHVHHESTRAWWEALPGNTAVHICRPVQTSLLRLLSTEAAMGDDALTLPDAWAVYATLLASGRFVFTPEPSGLTPLWQDLCKSFGRSPKIVMDAYLAAFAQAGGFRLATIDRAFAQFKRLEFEIPRRI